MTPSEGRRPLGDRHRPDPKGTDAVVLAAGRGVRLGALTSSTPKVLLRVNDRPLLDYHLAALREVGVQRVALVVHYLAEQVERHVDAGRPHDLDVTSVRQVEPLGTGDAVRAAIPWIRSDPFLVCYADIFVPTEADILRSFLSDATPKIAAARVPDGSRFGRLRTCENDGELQLVDIEEKDGRPGPALINAGLYLLPKSLLDRVARLPRSARGEYELTDALRELTAQGGRVRVVPVEDWVDCGTVESLARANALASRARSAVGRGGGMETP